MTTLFLFLLLLVVAAGGYGVGYLHGLTSRFAREDAEDPLVSEVRRLDRREPGRHARERVPLR